MAVDIHIHVLHHVDPETYWRHEQIGSVYYGSDAWCQKQEIARNLALTPYVWVASKTWDVIKFKDVLVSVETAQPIRGIEEIFDTYGYKGILPLTPSISTAIVRLMKNTPLQFCFGGEYERERKFRKKNHPENVQAFLERYQGKYAYLWYE